MGKPSRDKGKRGENEVVDLYHRAGCKKAKRTAALQSGMRHYGQLVEADVWIGDDFHVEVKRQEVLRLPAWLKQLDRDCPKGTDGILFYRRSRESWRAVISIALFTALEAELGYALNIIESPSDSVLRTGRIVVEGAELAGRMVEAGWV